MVDMNQRRLKLHYAGPCVEAFGGRVRKLMRRQSYARKARELPLLLQSILKCGGASRFALSQLSSREQPIEFITALKLDIFH